MAINKVMAVGRMTKDIQMRSTQSGLSVGSFTLAVERNFAGQDGKKQTDFIPCVVWRERADAISNYTRKGSQIAIEGSLQTRSYEANDGSSRFVMEVNVDQVQFLDPKGYIDKVDAQGGGTGGSEEVDFSFENDNSFDISDDDLPF